jgi:HD-like signal output (HDOD) protein
MKGTTFEQESRSHTLTILKSYDYHFNYANSEDKMYLCQEISDILHNLKKDFLIGHVNYIVQELIDNANKAIVKRIYFKKKGYDILDKTSYKEGMKNFSVEYYNKLENYTQNQDIKDFHLDVQFDVKEAFLTIMIKNKGLPTIEEMKRIQFRIEKSLKIRNTEDAFYQLKDETEGAGLGTATVILLLRKITDNPENIKPYQFYIDQHTNETVSVVNISLNTIPEKLTQKISKKIISEISNLPVYPENIMKLDRILDGKDIHLSRAAAVIERDPTLTAELLKVINSAQYFLPQKVKNILNAVSLIGINGLKSLLLSLGAKKILDEIYGKQEQLWEHAYRCAFYATMIAKDNNKNDLIDDVYICGILHDIGEIVIRSIDSDLTSQIVEFCENKGITGDIIEQLAMGCSHAKIGSQILHKWNFPEVIVSTVEYVDQPILSPPEWKDIVEIVYMANRYAMLHEKRILISSIDLEIFKNYNLNSAKTIQIYGTQLLNMYLKQQGKNS